MRLLTAFSEPRLLLTSTAVLSLGAVGLALVSQHVYGMEPCPWCVLQRLIFVVIALACGPGLFWRSVAGRRVSALVILALSIGGVGAALWQHFVAAASNSCNLTWADKIIGVLKVDSLLPEVFSPRASCADAAVNLLGLPYEFWSLALFVVIAVAGFRLLTRPLQ